MARVKLTLHLRKLIKPFLRVYICSSNRLFDSSRRTARSALFVTIDPDTSSPPDISPSDRHILHSAGIQLPRDRLHSLDATRSYERSMARQRTKYRADDRRGCELTLPSEAGDLVDT